MPFWRSSVDPNRIALTIKGLTALVPSLVIMLSLFHIDVGADALNSFIGSLADVFVVLGTLATAAVTAYGAWRKLKNPVPPAPPLE